MIDLKRVFKVRIQNVRTPNWKSNRGDFFYSSSLPGQKDGDGATDDSRIKEVVDLLNAHPKTLLWDSDGGYWTSVIDGRFYQVFVDAKIYGYV